MLTTTTALPPKSTPALSVKAMADAELAAKWLGSQRYTCSDYFKENCLYTSQPLKSLTNVINNEVDDDAFNFGSYSVILPEEPYVFGVSHIKTREVLETIQRPPYAMKIKSARKRPKQEAKITLGGEEEEKLRASSRLAKNVREFAGSLVKVGVTTNEIDAAVHEYICSHGAYPSPLLYEGFPKSDPNQRRSVNNVIVHGIPDDRRLEDGDILNIDITVYLDGYHGDTSQTWIDQDVYYGKSPTKPCERA
ncbi:hypothetical protein MPER_09763 [Moniliophthora perniciosa FA553]|nr:hypothetical protein MPER_09763 [Moniliophthora perniciosa FA553]